MPRLTLEFEFEMWERVWHVADAEAGRGIVTGYTISQQFTISYRVAFGPGREGWYFAEELTREVPVDFEA